MGHEIRHHTTLSIDGIAAMAVAIIYSCGECALEVTAQVSDNIDESMLFGLPNIGTLSSYQLIPMPRNRNRPTPFRPHNILPSQAPSIQLYRTICNLSLHRRQLRNYPRIAICRQPKGLRVEVWLSPVLSVPTPSPKREAYEDKREASGGSDDDADDNAGL
jgi:hypothetical protein